MRRHVARHAPGLLVHVDELGVSVVIGTDLLDPYAVLAVDAGEPDTVDPGVVGPKLALVVGDFLNAVAKVQSYRVGFIPDTLDRDDLPGVGLGGERVRDVHLDGRINRRVRRHGPVDVVAGEAGEGKGCDFQFAIFAGLGDPAKLRPIFGEILIDCGTGREREPAQVPRINLLGTGEKLLPEWLLRAFIFGCGHIHGLHGIVSRHSLRVPTEFWKGTFRYYWVMLMSCNNREKKSALS